MVYLSRWVKGQPSTRSSRQYGGLEKGLLYAVLFLLCKRLFPWLELVTSKSHNNNFIIVPKLPFISQDECLEKIWIRVASAHRKATWALFPCPHKGTWNQLCIILSCLCLCLTVGFSQLQTIHVLFMEPKSEQWHDPCNYQSAECQQQVGKCKEALEHRVIVRRSWWLQLCKLWAGKCLDMKLGRNCLLISVNWSPHDCMWLVWL